MIVRPTGSSIPMKNGVLILECRHERDPGSEGRFLKHLFNLMAVESSYVRVAGRRELLRRISRARYRYIHVSTHGLVNDDDRFLGWWTAKGSGSRRFISQFRGVRPITAIVSTACRSGAAGFARHVVGELGCRYYIAPQKSPTFYNAVLFAHVFYHKLFVTLKGAGVRRAFGGYRNAYKNPHKFSLVTRQKGER